VGVGLALALVVMIIYSLPETLLVSTSRVSVRTARGRVRWTVHRTDVAAVGWVRDERRAVTRLVFFDDRGVPVREAATPGTAARVDQALAERGWPIGRPASGPVVPPQA
jgi:hypothetical protein